MSDEAKINGRAIMDAAQVVLVEVERFLFAHPDAAAAMTKLEDAGIDEAYNACWRLIHDVRGGTGSPTEGQTLKSVASDFASNIRGEIREVEHEVSSPLMALGRIKTMLERFEARLRG